MSIIGNGKFDKVVASDSLKLEFGTFFNIVGVAIEIPDYTEFRHEYFKVLENLKDKYSIVNLPKIIKTCIKATPLVYAIMTAPIGHYSQTSIAPGSHTSVVGIGELVSKGLFE